MIINMKRCFVFVMCVCLSGVHSQNEETATTPTICSKCSCDQSNVDCRGMDIRASFTTEEWTELASLNPIQVDLSQNSIPILSAFPTLAIQRLNLSNSGIEHLENMCFTNLEDLVDLDLSYNKLSTAIISKMIFLGKINPDSPPTRSFTKFQKLNLAYNSIYSLPQNIFNFIDEITVLDLSGNPLTYIDQVTLAALSSLTMLKELYLSSCQLETLPDGLLRRQRQLERLDLSNNNFKTIPSVISEAPSLIYLNLDRNPIENIVAGNTFNQLRSLQELSICRSSQLQSIGASALGGLEGLKTLKICNNPKLSTVDPSFLMWTNELGVETWPVLRELYLNNNNITEVNSHMLERWDQLQIIDVANNPFVCDCDNQWMVDALIPLLEATTFNGSSANMVCKYPPDMRGLTFKYLKEVGKTLQCAAAESENITMFDADSVVLFGVMIGVFVTFPIVIITVSLWKRGYFSRCRKTDAEKTLYDDEAHNLQL